MKRRNGLTKKRFVLTDVDLPGKVVVAAALKDMSQRIFGIGKNPLASAQTAGKVDLVDELNISAFGKTTSARRIQNGLAKVTHRLFQEIGNIGSIKEEHLFCLTCKLVFLELVLKVGLGKTEHFGGLDLDEFRFDQCTLDQRSFDLVHGLSQIEFGGKQVYGRLELRVLILDFWWQIVRINGVGAARTVQRSTTFSS